MLTIKHFALASAAILLAAILLAPPTVEAVPASPPEIAVASYTPGPTSTTSPDPATKAAVVSALAYFMLVENAQGSTDIFLDIPGFDASVQNFVKMARENGTAVIPKIAEAMGMMYWNAANDSNPYGNGTEDHDYWQFFFLGTIVVIFVILAAYLVKNLKNLPQKVQSYKNTITKLKTKLTDFTSARKGLDIAEDGADAAATAAKAGSQTTGPGKIKALQDYLRKRRVATGDGVDNPLPSPGMGSSKWMKFVDKLRELGYSEKIIDKTIKGIRMGIIDKRYVKNGRLASHIDDFYSRHADDVDIFSDAAGEEKLYRLYDWKEGNDVAILQQGHNGYGWQHIRKKHITGEIGGGTTFPDKFGIDNELRIQRLIDDSIKYGTPTKKSGYTNRWTYEYSPPGQSGKKMLTVVDDGTILTSYPLV